MTGNAEHFAAQPYRVNPWHLAGHLWVLSVYGARGANSEGDERGRNRRAYIRQLDAYEAFMRGEP